MPRVKKVNLQKTIQNTVNISKQETNSTKLEEPVQEEIKEPIQEYIQIPDVPLPIKQTIEINNVVESCESSVSCEQSVSCESSVSCEPSEVCKVTSQVKHYDYSREVYKTGNNEVITSLPEIKIYYNDFEPAVVVPQVVPQKIDKPQPVSFVLEKEVDGPIETSYYSESYGKYLSDRDKYNLHKSKFRIYEKALSTGSTIDPELHFEQCIEKLKQRYSNVQLSSIIPSSPLEAYHLKYLAQLYDEVPQSRSLVQHIFNTYQIFCETGALIGYRQMVGLR